MHFKGIIWGRVGEKFEICVRKNKNNRGSAQFIWLLFKKMYAKIEELYYTPTEITKNDRFNGPKTKDYITLQKFAKVKART